MWSNPILQKELRVSMRNGRSFLLIALYITVLIMVICTTYPRGRTLVYRLRPLTTRSNVFGSSSGAVIQIDTNNAPEVGRKIFEAFTNVQFILVLMFVPALAATSFTIEKEKRMLEGMLVTPLSPHQIVIGKLMHCLLFMSLLVAASIPLTAVSFMLGGVSPAELAITYVEVTSLAIVTALLSITISAGLSRSHIATLTAYLIIAFLALASQSLFFATVVACIICTLWCCSFVVMNRQKQNWNWTRASSSGKWCYLIIVPILLFFFLSIDHGNPLSVFLPLLSLILIIPLTSFLISRPATPPRPLRHRLESLLDRRSKQVRERVNRGTRQAHGRTNRYGIWLFTHDHINPVFARELRRSLFGHRDQVVRALYIVTMLTEIVLIALSAFDDVLSLLPAVLRWYCAASVLLVLVFGGILGALSFTSEREQRSLDLLLTTPLSPAELVIGKYMAACYFTSYIILASIPVTCLAYLLNFVPVHIPLVMCIGLAIWGGFAAAMGVCSSLIFPRARQAVGFVLAVALAITAGSGIWLWMVQSQWRQYVVTPFSFQAVKGSLSPSLDLSILLPPYVINQFMSEVDGWFVAPQPISLSSTLGIVMNLSIYAVLAAFLAQFATALFRKMIIRHQT